MVTKCNSSKITQDQIFALSNVQTYSRFINILIYQRLEDGEKRAEKAS